MSMELDAPNLGALEKEYLGRCIDSGYVSAFGPFIPEFEQRFATFVGSPEAVSMQSGTAALHLAMYDLGIGPGDEVILPALSFVASANPILYLGATPVFADVDRRTWNIDPTSVEKCLTSRTKAIMPVHVYGNPCDMDALLDISKRHGVPIIEDATESLGGTWKGKATGTFGLYGCYSFNGNKVITTGGGGMLTTTDAERASHFRYIVNQARDAKKGYFHTELGFNYRMTNLEASLGLAQLDRLPGFLEKKARFARLYEEGLEALPGVFLQKELPGAKSSWWLSSMLVDRPGFDVLAFQEKLKAQGVPTRRIFWPMTDFPYLKQFTRCEVPNSWWVFERGLNLPSSTSNEDSDVYRVIEVVRALLQD